MAVPDSSLVLFITTNSVPWNLSPPAVGENALPVNTTLLALIPIFGKSGKFPTVPSGF
jgi:hypothetical protein